MMQQKYAYTNVFTYIFFQYLEIKWCLWFVFYLKL